MGGRHESWRPLFLRNATETRDMSAIERLQQQRVEVDGAAPLARVRRR